MEDKKYCCNVLPKILCEFNWFSYTDDKTNEDMYVMPYIETRQGDKWKINHCVSCGSNIKSIRLTYNEIYNNE